MEAGQCPYTSYHAFNILFMVETDASFQGLEWYSHKKVVGKIRVILYVVVTRYRGGERNYANYSVMNLELIALKLIITNTYIPYIIGSKCLVFSKYYLQIITNWFTIKSQTIGY